MIHTTLPALLLTLLPVPQEGGQKAPPAAWTQSELERVSAEIQAQIETLRGMKFDHRVPVKVTDKQGLLEYMKKRQEATESPERRKRDESVAKLLGLVPRGFDLGKETEKLLEQQVGGFYDPGTGSFCLMDSFTGDLARIILAHELTHALDDANFGLDDLVKGAGEETDAEWAIQAMAEGSGTNAMNVWTLRHAAELDRKALMDSSDLGTKGLDEAPTLIWKPLLAAYLRGEGFLVHTESMNVLMKSAKTEELRRCFKDPPRSSEQILHPKKYWDPRKRDDPVKLDFDTHALPEGWSVIGQDTLGELYLGLVTQPFAERGGLDAKNPAAILGVKYTNPAVEGWGGDRLLLASKGDALVLYLVTVWDTPQDASEFHEALRGLVQRDEQPVQTIVSGPEQERLDWLAGLSDVELTHLPEISAVTLRLEHKTKKGAGGLPKMLLWSIAKPPEKDADKGGEKK